MYNERIKDYYNVNKINFDKCNITKYLILNKTLGFGAFGIVKKYYIKNNINSLIAVKEIDIIANKNNQTNEIKALQKCSELVLNKNALNLPILYNFCIDKKIYLLLEYYDMNMMEWCETKHTVEEWMSAYFQIFCGLYSLEKYTNIYLCDIKFENILVKKIQKGFIHYIIDNTIYFIPNCSYLFVLSDFGITKDKNNKRFYNVDNICNNYISSQNLDNYDNIKIIEYFKEKFNDKYIKFYNEMKNKLNNGSIKVNMKINGVDATYEQKIKYLIFYLIKQNIIKDKYNLFIKDFKDFKEIYFQQPLKIIKNFNNLENMNFNVLFPKLFKKYIKEDNNLKYKLNILDTYIL